jgi:hypothetical protein
VPDQDWANLARGSREALRQIGYTVTPRCLPGEPDACGGSFAQHAMANLATLTAAANHHLIHMGPLAALAPCIYDRVSAEIEADCAGPHPR